MNVVERRRLIWGCLEIRRQVDRLQYVPRRFSAEKLTLFDGDVVVSALLTCGPQSIDNLRKFLRFCLRDDTLTAQRSDADKNAARPHVMLCQFQRGQRENVRTGKSECSVADATRCPKNSGCYRDTMQ